MSVLRTQLQGIARRPSRLLLTGLAVLVASFVVFATVLSYQVVTRAVLDGLSGTPESTSLVVESDGGEKGISVADLAKLRSTPGVAEVAGRGGSYFSLAGQTNGGGFSLMSDPGKGQLSQVKLVEGTYPDGPNEVAVSERTVKRANLSPGSTLRVQYGEKQQLATLTVTGVVTASGDGGEDLFAPDDVTAAFLSSGHFRVDIRAADGTDVEALRTSVRSVLAGVTQLKVATGAEVRQTEAERATDDLNVVFAMGSMFIVIAVVAAGLVATSTFRIVFAQRMRQLALLRAVGAGRGKLTSALAIEGLLVGLVAGVVGVVTAGAVGLFVPLIGEGVDADLPAPGFPLLPALGVVLGAMFVTLIAVLAPAVSASKVAPLEALRSAATAGGKAGIGVLRTIAGIVFILAAAASAAYVWQGLPDLKEAAKSDYDPSIPMLMVVFSGGMAFCALVALGPVVLRPLLAVVGWPLRRLGPVGRLAVGGVGGAPRRAAAVSVVVALGVTLIAGVLVGAASIQTLADREMALSAPADLELKAMGDAPLPATTITKLRQNAALKDIATYRRIEVKRPGGNPEEVFTANDLKLTALPALEKVDTSEGSFADIGPGKALVSGYALESFGAKLGDSLELLGPKGQKVTVVVAATMQGSGPMFTDLTVDSSDLDKLGAQNGPSGLLANASAEGEDGRAAAIDAVNSAVGSSGSTQLGVLADERDQFEQILAGILAVVLGLVGLTVIIAVVGVGTTTALSVVERVRESGLLRAVGVSKAGLRTMLTTEAGLYGVIGATLGLLIGVPYAWLTVLSMGVEAPLELPVLQLLGVFVLLTALTAAAGLLPARKAAKVSPVTALGSDE